MKNILLINGSKRFGRSGGRLSANVLEVANDTLQSIGSNIVETHIEEGYDVESEAHKL